ncbi:MAG: NERD domain-containing protein [Solirubrobacteraceae bacterium]
MVRIQLLRHRTGGVNHARRQQYRRLSRAARLGLMSATATVLGLFAIANGGGWPGALLAVLAAVVGFRARHWLALARRSGVGARSEEEVRRVLAPLERHGWRLRRGVRWRGGGDIDSLAIAPTGIGFAIETKTRSYEERQLGRVLEQATWLGRRRRRWCRRGAAPVLCVVRAAGVERYELGVLVVSIDRLVPALRAIADGAEPVRTTPLHGRLVA